MAARTVRCFVTVIFQCMLLTDSSQVSGLARLQLQRSQAGVQQGSDCFDLTTSFQVYVMIILSLNSWMFFSELLLNFKTIQIILKWFMETITITRLW